MKKYLLLAALAFACQAQAANYYFSDCTPGAVAACKPGNDLSATPGNPTTPLRTLVEAVKRFGTFQAGDHLLFAQGGSFDAELNGEIPMQNLNSTVANPIVLESYKPTWYSGKNKPILNQRGTGLILWFSDGGSPEADGGYIVRNLRFQGTSAYTSTALFINQLAHDVLLDNLEIDKVEIGVYCGDKIQNVQLKNSKLTNVKVQGVLWGCGGTSAIENNTFDNTGFGHLNRDHPIYLTEGASGTVIGNTVTNSVHFNDGGANDGKKCTGVVIVAHNRISNLLVADNIIKETGASSGGCWGIAFDSGNGDEIGAEGFHNIVIRGNKLVNVGNMGIGCTSCDDIKIENNVLVWEYPGEITAISVPDKKPSPEDDPTGAVTIRNNSIYIKTSEAWTSAIRTAEVGNYVVSSNLIFFGPTSDATTACFDTTNRTINNFTNFSNNLCYKSGGTLFSWAYATQAAAQAADARWNKNGLTVNPQLVATPTASNNYSMKHKTTSPAVNAGNATYCSTTSIEDVVRGVPCDIGAYER